MITAIHQNPELQAIAKSHGVTINYVSWEDAGKTNVTDMTLVVDRLEMPIIRKANITDETISLPISTFNVVVGNENSTNLRTIALSEYLINIATYSGNTELKSLLVSDEKIVTSSQHCILPENSEFAVKLYNHETRDEDPAVLVIMATSQGTSCQVLHGKGEELFFNRNGRSVKLMASREVVHQTATVSQTASSLTTTDDHTLLLFQVPLKQREVMLTRGGFFGNFGNYPTVVKNRPQNGNQPSPPARGLSQAVLSLGGEHGVYQGTKGLRLVRDATQSIRCTIQRYSITDSDTISPMEIKLMATKIHQLLDTDNSFVKVVR